MEINLVVFSKNVSYTLWADLGIHHRFTPNIQRWGHDFMSSDAHCNIIYSNMYKEKKPN